MGLRFRGPFFQCAIRLKHWLDGFVMKAFSYKFVRLPTYSFNLEVESQLGKVSKKTISHKPNNNTIFFLNYSTHDP